MQNHRSLPRPVIQDPMLHAMPSFTINQRKTQLNYEHNFQLEYEFLLKTSSSG